MHIHTVPEEEAAELLAELYATDRKKLGYVPNYTRAMSLRPDTIQAWRSLSGAVRANMRLRRYELVTFAAARALRCAYCLQAHAAVLRKESFSAEQLIAIMADYRHAGLEPVEVECMAFAEKITRDATSVTSDDVARLRALGLSDAEILDVALAAALRNFFSKLLDAVGAEPDAAYVGLEPELRQVLTVGHPLIDEKPIGRARSGAPVS